MSKKPAEEAQQNYEDLKRAGEKRKNDQKATHRPPIQNSRAAAKRARKDSNSERLKRSWIARERALATGSPTLIELAVATALGVGRRLVSLR
ncbi:hypothetical protein [Nocardioides marmorisolisilvae]|uniref:hypothetical protein n=1 Tax=Nocardioides marmorisolisilvae TaxID=1542737 RepID=UPI0011CD61A5|nr:hypothetical protein [Nocardioides marmorisolisilvae]